MRFRVGVIGAGHISEFHLQGLKRLESVDIVGITDLDVRQAESRAKQFGLHVFDSLESLLAVNPNAVHVLTPPATHADITIRSLEAGCHAFVEKPLATTVADCDRIIAAARQTAKTVGVDHSLLRDPFTLKALELVQGGRIGDVLNVECHRSQDCPLYAGGPLPPYYQEGGFPFRDIGIHAFYQIEAFLGEIKEATWSYQQLGTDPNLEFDDWRVTLQCERGTAHVHLSWNIRPLQDLITIQGTKGTIRLDRFGMKVTTKTENPLPEHPQRAANALREGLQTFLQVPTNLGRIVTKNIRRYHGLQEMIANFYESLANNRQPLAAAEDARRIGYWVEQVAAAADRDKRRKIAERQPARLQAKTLVTGATGFIGGHLLNRLLEEDSGQIRIFCRRPVDELSKNPRIETIVGDLGDPDAVDRACAGIDRIYHVGGTVHGDCAEFRRGNVAATKNIVDSALKHGVTQLVYVSSLSVLHSAAFTSEKMITESWPLEPNAEERGHYTQTKLEAEQIVTHAVKNHNLPAVILRPAEVIGAGAPLLSSGVAKRLRDYLVILGDGTLAVPLVNVHDLIDAIQMSVQRGITDGSIYQIVDDEQCSQNELAENYAAMTGESISIVRIPRWFLSLAAIGVQTLGRVGRRSAPLSPYRLQSALSKRQFDCAKAKTELGWHASRGVDNALRDTLRTLNSAESCSVEHSTSTEPIPCVSSMD